MFKTAITIIILLNIHIVFACSKRIEDKKIVIGSCETTEPLIIQEQDLPYIWKLKSYDLLEKPKKSNKSKSQWVCGCGVHYRF